MFCFWMGDIIKKIHYAIYRIKYVSIYSSKNIYVLIATQSYRFLWILLIYDAYFEIVWEKLLICLACVELSGHEHYPSS